MFNVRRDLLVALGSLQVRSGDWCQQLLAGGVAGVVSRTSTAPIDRLKVMLQAHASRSNNLGVFSGFKYMLNEGGVVSLWRGNGINVVKVMPEAAFKFALYEQIKRYLKGSSNKELASWERFIAGAMAGAIAQTSIYPLEVMKTRLALGTTGQYKGISDCAVQLFKQNGIKAFYRGYVPNLLGILPYAGIDLTVYESLKKLYIRKSNEKHPGILVLLACGTVSSTCGQLVCYPFMLIRTKLQAGVLLSSESSVLSMVKSVVLNEGFRGLYRGIVPNFMKVAPAVSISYVVYEKTSEILGCRMS